MRVITAVLLCMIIGLSLCACGSAQQTYDITEYLNCFAAMDYSAMYALTAPVVDIDEEAFVQKYEAIFSGLGVTEVVIENVSGPTEDGVYTYTATYKTEEYGDFTNDFTLNAGIRSDACMVLWDYSLIFPEMEEGSSVRVETEEASRGEIFAADGTLLAANTYADTVYMNTSKVEDITEVADVIVPITDLTNTEIIDMFNAAVEDETEIVVLDAFYPDELTDEQKESILSVAGLGIDDEIYTLIRSYPLGEKAAHIIGYTGYVSEDELPEGYSDSERIGIAGLESAYESELHGTDGKIIYIRDKWGKNVRTLYEVPVEEGEDLRLTIDASLQEKAYDALDTYLDLEQGESGVALVLDASTGYVEAAVSYPSYDNNWFTFSRSNETWEYLNADENNQPLFSRITQGLYPPGSVLKPFTAAIALDTGTITEETVFEGEIVDNQWTIEDGWKITRIEDSGTPLKLYNAMIKSDNIYFAYVALQLGDDTFLDYLERIGLEEAVPFDLPVKEANTVNATSSMTKYLLADMGYGQGELLVTPVQLAAMYTAFANGTGDMMEPILVERICQTDGLDYNTISTQDPTVWIEDAVSSESMQVLSPILEAVIESGTGHGAKVSGVSIAGKTGTAEIGDDKSREISWFVGYWLDGSYDRLVVVMVDVAAEAGQVKFSIAKELLSP